MDMSNDFGMMLHDKIRTETNDFSTLSDFDRFVLDRGYYYKTEAELNAAYARAKKAGRGELVTKAEFDAEMRRDHADRLYDVLAELVAKGILTPGELFAYARFGWCANAPESVIYYQTGAGKYAVNNCDTQIPEAEAIVKVCWEWGFEASRVKIIGTPYYDSTDWQFKYVGRVTDTIGGVVFIRLNNGVNAIAHTCKDPRRPGRKDDVSFIVTKLDEEQGVAIGIITKIIRQNL